MFKKLITALAAAVLVAVPVASAQAATASWTTTVNGPVMYETNRIYESVPLKPPTGTPSTGRIAGMTANVEWVYSDRTDIVVKLCSFLSSGERCETIPLWTTKSYTTTYFDGIPATSQFYFKFQVPTAKANAVFRNAQYPGKLTTAVTYNTP